MAVVASGAYSLLGINADSVPTMQEAVRDYKQNVVEPLEKLSGNVEYTNAFKGSVVAETVRNYLEAVIAKLHAMLDYIDEFDRSLEQVRINYEGQAESISSTVASDADSVESREVQTTPGVKGYTPTGGPGGNSGSRDTGGDTGTNPGGGDTSTGSGDTGTDPGGGDTSTGSGDGPTGDGDTSGTQPSPDGDYDFNNNGIDTSRIAGSESEAMAGDFIPEDHIYDPSFESDGVTFHDGENGGIRIDNEGIPIGWTDVIGEQNP